MVQTLRTLTRGLDVVRALNRNDGAGLRLIATETGLSRGAVHRLLETLVTDGYVRKVTGHYYLERKLHTLTAGLAEGDWVSSAQPAIVFGGYSNLGASITKSVNQSMKLGLYLTIAGIGGTFLVTALMLVVFAFR